MPSYPFKMRGWRRNHNFRCLDALSLGAGAFSLRPATYRTDAGGE
jgi:hypothetical protein